MKLKLTVEPKISETCIGTTMTLRGITNLDPVQKRIRRVIWLQIPAAFWVDRGTIYLSY